jgi:DNA-binding response OmpR family regulator
MLQLVSSGLRTMERLTHLLLIEDQINLARFIQLELEERGYQVSIAGNIRLALQILQNSQPHLIIFDWELPNQSSRATYERLQAQTNRVPVLITTVQENDQADLDAKSNYLLMPFSIQELWTKIESCLSQPQISEVDERADVKQHSAF